jgi:hypothetical protein
VLRQPEVELGDVDRIGESDADLSVDCDRLELE